MLRIKKFDNELMNSNCYAVWDDSSEHCLLIDPASRLAHNEIEFIEQNNLILDYIFLTHEHTDHTWGVNELIHKFKNTEVICSDACRESLPKAGNHYFMFYYDDPNYSYCVEKVDHTTESFHDRLKWNGHTISFIHSPGHSIGSICIKIDDKILFSGDTLMQFKPFINKRDGSFKTYEQTVAQLLSILDDSVMIYPGHGTEFLFKDYKIPKFIK